ncbi:putative transporter protein [Halomicronema hongdechloris C2206]|uniref:Transporter protein n=1 Tax=Halomicronema hongdechloris C2206 TaxID=1641165 RepID=A0A1Z3HMV4_9CYAN|nr:FTR1 family protein [Halomicronema hongdechloris]ASC71605.1 putative transporter protein [Halomicronema hongdechloris C2206]
MASSVMGPLIVLFLSHSLAAAMTVGILSACLEQAKQPSLGRWLYGGVIVGGVGSGLLAVVLQQELQQITPVLPELGEIIGASLEVLFGAIALVLLSWILLWLARQARWLNADWNERIAAPKQQSETTGWSLFSGTCILMLQGGIAITLELPKDIPLAAMAIAILLAGALALAIATGIALVGRQLSLARFFQLGGGLLLLVLGGLVLTTLGQLDASLASISRLGVGATDLCISRQSCILGPLLWDPYTWLLGQLSSADLPPSLGYTYQIYLLQVVISAVILLVLAIRYFRDLGLALGEATGGKGA